MSVASDPEQLWCNAAEEDFVDPDTGNTLNATAVCLFWLNEADIVEAARLSTIQSTLNNRLTVAATVGDTALASAVTAIQNANPEVAAVILADTGADPLKYPYLVRHSALPALSLLGVNCYCHQTPWPSLVLTPHNYGALAAYVTLTHV